uniref:Alpha-D-phosphohexomutase alpha/beta/alpha domain-containing protein n=1 Tax=Populus alba TaxID=43335 RepID=A0A4U5NQ02_POPAL|nr:hypothetical protein D5086_0000251860 [Populus alba]
MGYQWLGNKEKGRVGENVRVSLGRDPRLSGASLSVAVFSGLDRADDSITLAIHFVMGSNFFTRRGGLTSRRWRRFAVKLRIIVNAGNGSGGFFTWDVLDKLGAETFGSLHINPDGMFPNHIPNPEDKIAMALTRAAVLENSADLGIVFDH